KQQDEGCCSCGADEYTGPVARGPLVVIFRLSDKCTDQAYHSVRDDGQGSPDGDAGHTLGLLTTHNAAEDQQVYKSAQQPAHQAAGSSPAAVSSAEPAASQQD